MTAGKNEPITLADEVSPFTGWRRVREGIAVGLATKNPAATISVSSCEAAMKTPEGQKNSNSSPDFLTGGMIDTHEL